MCPAPAAGGLLGLRPIWERLLVCAAKPYFQASFSTRPLGPAKKWSADEVDALREYRAQGLNRAAIASLMGRTEGSILAKSRKLHETTDEPYSKLFYTEAENDKIRSMIQSKFTVARMLEAMPHRSYHGIKTRARMLRRGAKTHAPNSRASRRLWTLDEENLLLKLHEQDLLPLPEMVKHFPLRSYSSIEVHLRRLRPKQPAGMPRYKPWTEADDAVLEQMKSNGDSAELIATALSRSLGSVKDRLKIPRSSHSKRATMAPSWSKDEFDLVKSLRAQSKKYHEIEALLPGRTLQAVREICTTFKIPSPD